MVKPAGEARRIFTSLENSQTAATTNASDAFSLRSAVLDLCYSEGWTYDKTTQEKLISHLADYFPPPDLWTHQFIREQYEEFRGSNSCSGLSWCSRPYNYRRLWILENLLTVHVTGGERPDWRTFLQHSNALGNQSIILLEEGNAAGGLSDENARILDQTLRELQPQWFPYSKVEVVRGHVTAFIQRYGVHAPFTPGFILQVIQDMEDEGFLTTCYKRGKLLELLSKLKNRRDTRIIGTLIKIISNQASQQEHHKQVTDPVAKEMLHTLGYQFLNEQYRILSSDEDAVGDDLTNDTIERLKAIKEARDTSISKSDPRYTGAECSFLRIIYDLLSLNEVTVMLQSPHRLMFHDSNSRCPEKFGVSRFCMVGEVLCDRYGFKACPKEGKFWVFRHHASLDRKEDILSLKSVAKATTAKKAIVATKTPVLIRDFLRILFEMADKSDENHVVFDEGKLYLHGVRADFENNVFPHYFSSGQQPKYRDFLKNLGRFGFAYLKKTTSFSVFRHESVKRPGDILKLRASTSRNSPNNASPKSSGSNANPSSSPNKSTSPDTEAAKRAALSDNKTRSIPPSKKAKKTCAKTAVAVATTTTAIQADKTWLEKMHEMLLNENQAFSFIPRNGHQPAQLIINWDPDKITKLLPKYFTTGTPSNDAFRQQLRHYGFTVVLRHDQKVTLENPNVEKLDDVCILKRRRRASAPFLQLQVQSPRAQRGTQKSDANERNGDTREHTATVENMESALAQNIVSTVKKVPEKQNKGAEESNDIGQTASEPTDKITTTQSPPPEPQKVLTPRAYTNDSSKFVTKLVDLLAMDETAISFQEGSNDNHGCIIMHDKAKVEKLVWSVFKFKRYGTFVKVLNKYRFYAIMGYGSSSNAMYANTNVKKLDDIIRMNGLEPKTEDNTGKRKRKPRRHFDEIEESMASKKLKTVVLQEVKTSQFPSKPPPHVREVGARVYAEFVTDELHPDDRWFFGTIYQVNKDTKIRTYDVLFDDGDTSEGLFANQVCTERDYSEKYRFGVAMPELTEDRKKELAKLVSEGVDGNDSVPQNKGSEKQMSLEQLFKSRCNKCRMCKMKDCGRCATCLYNQDNPEVERRVCYWKMCLKIDLSQRKRPAVGFPNGWTFVIGKANNPTRKHLTKSGILDTDIVPGLNLFSPSNGRMLSAIRAKHEYPSLQHPPKIELQLYRLLGSRISDSMFDLAADSTRTVGTKVAIASQTDGWNIGNYVYCRWKNEEFYWAKIQCVWHVGSVAHFQVDFVDGSGDVDSDITEFSSDKTKKLMYSEKEMKAQGQTPPRDVFIETEGHEKGVISSGKHVYGKGYDTLQLEEHRCGRCRFCTAEDCGACYSCRLQKPNQPKRSCIRKMCNLIPIEKKAQSAPGLPPGWTFVFCDKLGGKAIEDSEHFFGANFVTLEYLQILSSDKRQAFNRIGDAFGHFSEMLNIDTDGQMDRFCTQIGAHLARDEPDHPLVGRFFCQEWLGLDYRRRTLYGKIEKSARLEGGLHESIIYLKYDKNSLTNNRRRNLLNSKVQAIEPTEERVAYGAALKFEQLHGLKNDPLEATDLQDEVLLWRVPDMVTEETISVPGSNHKKMARLTIQIDRFLLTFTAKKSTIKNAGYGVFVSCVPLCGGGQEAEKFALRKGELVDIGIYSPLRIEDKRSSVVFAVKNFVLELKPEVYSFNSQNDEEQYDICDDHSGVCHEMAQSRINMYVNECSSHGLSTIHAEHDPEGHVHYLFGQKQSGFEMLANGEEREIFVNYGPDYEDVRIRKNYSFLGEEEQQLRRENMKLELIEYLQSTATRLSAKDILDVVAYFTGALGEFLDKANENAKFRLLVASLLLRYRACWLMQRNQQLPINRKRSIDTKQISAAVERSKHLAFTMLQSHGDKQLILLYAKGKDENLIRTVVVNFLSAAGTPKDRAVSFLDGLFDSRDRVG